MLYKKAGQQGQPVTFIFTESEIKDEGFLEYLNAILVTGEVTNLFPKDEMSLMAAELRPIALKVRLLTDYWYFFPLLYWYFLLSSVLTVLLFLTELGFLLNCYFMLNLFLFYTVLTFRTELVPAVLACTDLFLPY